MSEIVFKRNMNIGTISAEHDLEFLKSCFIKTPEFEDLCDFSNRKMILLGRTGSGKTALLNEIKNSVDCFVQIKPDVFAFQYLSSVPFVKKLIEANVNLDIFYKFLWLHEIISQIIKNYFAYQKKDFFIELKEKVSSLGRISQLKKYLDEYDGVFFDEGCTEKITKEIEQQVMASVGLSIGKLEGKLSDSEKREIQVKTSQYINKKQITQLKNIITLLKDYYSKNKQKKIVIAIDNLDDKWIEDDSKYKLIDALLYAIKEFTDIQNLKILIAMRSDLLAKTCEITKRQNEKDNAFTLRLDWNKQMLEDVLNKRISYLFSYKYKKQTKITFKDLFNFYINGIPATDYIINRSMMRPRDLISFVNLCIIEADGNTCITENDVLTAEKKYQSERLQALEHEWFNVYGNLETYLNIIYKITNGHSFNIDDFVKKYDTIELILMENAKNDECCLANTFMNTDHNNEIAKEKNIRQLLNILFTIGLIGIKEDNGDIYYTSPLKPSLSILDFNKTINFIVYPLFENK